MASWRQPYRSALRDLAQSLISQADVKRRNDEQLLMMQMQQNQQNAELTENIFGTVGQTAQQYFALEEQQRQRLYDEGMDKENLVVSYVNQANEMLSTAELLRQNNPSALADDEYNAMVQAHAQITAMANANPADWPRLLAELGTTGIVPTGARANIFSAAEIADGTAAAALENPLTALDVLSRGSARAAVLTNEFENTKAAKERNVQMLDQQMSLITAGITQGGNGIVRANLAADIILDILNKGNLPDTLDVETYRDIVSQAQAAIANNPDLLAELEVARAQTQAEKVEADFRITKANVDNKMYEDIRNLDYDTAAANLAGVTFDNEMTAFEVFQTYGVVSNQFADEVRVLYERAPLRDENGNVLSFEAAQSKYAADAQERAENLLTRERKALELVGVQVDTAKLQYEADAYNATYMTFDADMAREDALRTRIANAIVMGDVAYLNSLQANHADRLRRLNLYDSVTEGINEAQTNSEIKDLQNTLAIAELNGAINNQGIVNMAERTAAVMSILESRAAYMTPEAIDNWWGSLSPNERLMFGTEAEARGLIEGAKNKSRVASVFEGDALFQSAWRRASALAELDVSEGNIGAMQQEVKDILSPVLGENAANEYARSFADAWAQGNQQDVINNMALEIENAKIEQAYAIMQEFGVGALSGPDLESVNSGRQLLDVRLDALNNRRILLEQQARAGGCLPGPDGFIENEGSDTCIAINESLLDVDEDFVDTVNRIDNFMVSIFGNESIPDYVPNQSEIQVGAATIAGAARDALEGNLLGPNQLAMDYATVLIDNFMPQVPESARDRVRDELYRQVEMMLRDMGTVPMYRDESGVPVAPATTSVPAVAPAVDTARTPGQARADAFNEGVYSFGRNVAQMYENRIQDPFAAFLERANQGYENTLDAIFGIAPPPVPLPNSSEGGSIGGGRDSGDGGGGGAR